MFLDILSAYSPTTAIYSILFYLNNPTVQRVYSLENSGSFLLIKVILVWEQEVEYLSCSWRGFEFSSQCCWRFGGILPQWSNDTGEMLEDNFIGGRQAEISAAALRRKKMKIKEETMLPVANQCGGQRCLVGRWGGHTATRPGGPFEKVIEKSMVFVFVFCLFLFS